MNNTKKRKNSAARALGRKGGAKTAAKGPDHYRMLQKKGVKARKSNRKKKLNEVSA